MGKFSKRTSKELFAIALETRRIDPDAEAAWDAISVLRRRATPKIYRKARKLCRSTDPRERELGVDILAQFGHRAWKRYPLRKQRVRFLLKVLETETDNGVLYALTIAFGHLHSSHSNSALLSLKNHPVSEVRYGVAFGLVTNEDKYPDAIDALIELSTDRDDDVRDWATFKLGTQLDLDTPEIREALYARLSDTHQETFDEALVGLAKRKDQRVFEPLLTELTTKPDWSVLDFEAAEELADARLLPALRGIQADWQWHGKDEKSYHYRSLLDAIRACEAAR